MKLTIFTTLLTVSLVTAAFCAEEAALAPQLTPPITAKTPPTPSALASPVRENKVPAPPAVTATVSAPSRTPSFLESKPLTLGPLAASAPVKLGYVEIQKIFQESKTGQKAIESLKKTRDKFRKLLTAKGKKLEAQKKTLESQAKQMNPLEQEAKGKEFQAKVAEFQESGQKAEKEISKQSEEIKSKLQEQIAKKIKEYGEKNGYTLIAAELLYSDGNQKLTDVTDDLIKYLDK